MELTTREGDGHVVLDLSGRLTAATAGQLTTAVQQSIEGGQARVAVDLARVAFIDSSGLGALVGALKAARAAGGDLRIAGAPAQTRQVLRLTNLDRVLHVYTSAEEAFDE